MNLEITETAQNLILIQRQIKSLSRDFPLGIGAFGAFCCAIILEKKESRSINLKVLASYLMVSPATMTRYSKKLEAQDWLVLEKLGREVTARPTIKSENIAIEYLEFVGRLIKN